ncbi:MAG: GlsB/YeaQ/YmgE family stress response membrane protein [Clostridiaceae bacterium]|nr:GlsB/YeaQ/YmgE family stress response membrane protein [Clostridiaceae bacterium]
MTWLAWIVLGGIAGWVASLITKNSGQMGILWNVIVGIIGGVAGNFILGQLGVKGLTGFTFYSFLVALGGAVLLLVIYNLIIGRKR